MSDYWDDITIDIATDDHTIELWTCLQCGALVRGLLKDTHEGWHRRNDSRELVRLR